MEASVDKPVTYTGDKLTVHVELDNNSGRQVHAIKVKLKQTWTYGTGYFEKFTISKVKHKVFVIDVLFYYEPNIVCRIQNSHLDKEPISVTYHL
jgi:hypothetical protein